MQLHKPHNPLKIDNRHMILLGYQVITAFSVKFSYDFGSIGVQTWKEHFESSGQYYWNHYGSLDLIMTQSYLCSAFTFTSFIILESFIRNGQIEFDSLSESSLRLCFIYLLLALPFIYKWENGAQIKLNSTCYCIISLTLEKVFSCM